MTVIKIKKTKIRNLKNLKKRLMNPLFGRPLPKDIINLIFSFDGTYRDVFKKCMNEYAKGSYQAPKFGYKNRAESYQMKLDNYGKNFIKNKKTYFNRHNYPTNKYHDNYEEKTAVWVDSKYTCWRGNGQLYYNEDTNKMELVSLQHTYWSGKAIRVDLQVPYSITYENKNRDWTRMRHYENANFPPFYANRFVGERVRMNLPIYKDKAIFTYNTLPQSINPEILSSNVKSYIRKQKWVKPFLKNIKKFKKYHPNLCDF